MAHIIQKVSSSSMNNKRDAPICGVGVVRVKVILTLRTVLQLHTYQKLFFFFGGGGGGEGRGGVSQIKSHVLRKYEEFFEERSLQQISIYVHKQSKKKRHFFHSCKKKNELKNNCWIQSQYVFHLSQFAHKN